MGERDRRAYVRLHVHRPRLLPMFLQDFRVLLGCSLGTVARDLRVPRSTIAKIETGRMPGVKHRVRLLRYYAEAIIRLDPDAIQQRTTEYALVTVAATLRDTVAGPGRRNGHAARTESVPDAGSRSAAR